MENDEWVVEKIFSSFLRPEGERNTMKICVIKKNI